MLMELTLKTRLKEEWTKISCLTKVGEKREG